MPTVVEIILERHQYFDENRARQNDGTRRTRFKPEDATNVVDYRIDSKRMQNIERTRTTDAAQKKKTRGRAVRTFGGSGAIPPASQVLTQGLYQNVEMVRAESIHN